MGLSTHILDTALGRPAVQVGLTLSRLDGEIWNQVGSGETDADGRCRTLLGEQPLQAAIYKIRFDTSAYFVRQAVEGLYPFVDIVFAVSSPEEHYHIPLLLTPNGYTTYRGS
jgi:5-hydroxyisourate hydrolase